MSFLSFNNYNLNQVYTRSFTTTEAQPFCIRAWGNSNNITYEFQLWLCEGTNNTIYEKYTNGASPNPTFPQPISVVTGTQEVAVKGKNLFDKNSALKNKTFTGQDVVSDSTGLYISDYIKVKPNTAYYVNQYCSVVLGLDENKNSLGYIRNTSQAGSFTTSSGCEYVRVRLYNTSIDMETAINNAQLEEGSTATSYEPYITPTTYQVHLGNLELAKIGNYQVHLGSLELASIGTYQDYIYFDVDEGKWYKHNLIGKLTLNGNETDMAAQQATNSPNYTYFYTAFYDSLIKPNVYDGICNKFVVRKSSMQVGTQVDSDTINIGDNGYAKIRCMILSSRLESADLSGVRQWLANNLPIIYYISATATDEEITDETLIQDLDNIYAMMSVEGTTIIEVSGNLSANIKVRAYAQLQAAT